ncbi:MAG TPA: hypothetical protein VFW22_04885 [Pseudolabrys sp.]|nr:hypothetical protein [Pseudolabrys sp.]
MAVVALMLAAPAAAQENLDSGKTGAQLYAADCALCHKNPQTLNKSGGLFGLSGFLREHYTASKESAASIAAYLQTVGNAPAPAKRTTKRTPKGDDKAKLDEDKKGKDKSGEAKGEDKAKVDAEKKTKAKSDEDKAKVDAEKKPKAKSGEDKAEKSEKTGQEDIIRPEPKSDDKSEKKTEKKSSGVKSDSKSGEPKTKESKDKDEKASPPKEAKAKKKPGSAATAKPDKPDKSD